MYGMIRRSSSFNTGRIDHIYQDPHEPDVRLRLVYADLADAFVAQPAGQNDPAGRDLQPRRTVARAGELRDSGVHGGHHRAGLHAAAGSDSRRRT